MATRPGLLARLTLCAIRGYQRYLSPHKGFTCAWRCATGRDGCSGYGYRVIERFGLSAGLVLLQRRLRLCGDTYRRRAPAFNPLLHYQRGDCDPGCGSDCACQCGGDLLGEYLQRKYRRARERWRAT